MPPPSSGARRAAAEAWLRRKEAEAKKPGGFEKISGARAEVKGDTLGDAITNYVSESEKKVGRTKTQVLNTTVSYEITLLPCAAVTSQDIVAFAQDLLGGGRQPQKVQN